jgi:hypothetical protein
MKVLVGHTGFVGSNLSKSFQFDEVYNSSNITKAYGTNPDLLVYSGIKAEMFLANKFPEQDKLDIDNAISNIKKINPKSIVLISTISIYDITLNVNENHKIDNSVLLPYGKNRYYLEEWVKENIENYLIVRLPALYGINLKKNFIFDFINLIPAMLNAPKFMDLTIKEPNLAQFYILQTNGFYKCREIYNDERLYLKSLFQNIGFNALYFTDSRARFQFYNLSYLWKHIEIAISRKIKVLNLATEPIEVSELFNYLTTNTFKNEINNQFPNQDLKTLFYKNFDGENGYIFNKDFVLNDIKDFIKNAL